MHQRSSVEEVTNDLVAVETLYAHGSRTLQRCGFYATFSMKAGVVLDDCAYRDARSAIRSRASCRSVKKNQIKSII
jgi:hypothetical protein